MDANLRKEILEVGSKRGTAKTKNNDENEILKGQTSLEI